MNSVEKERAREAWREAELKQIKAKQHVTEMETKQMDIVKKGEAMMLLQRLQDERTEALHEEELLRAQEARLLAPEQVQQMQKLAQEVLRLKNKEVQDQKRQQVLRDTSIELKQLQAQLRSTYVAKTAQVQLKESKARREAAKCREKQQALMIRRWYQDDSFDRKLALLEHEKKTQYRRDLQDQLVNNYLLRQQKAEEDQRDGRIVQQITQVICDEDLRLENERVEKLAHLAAEKKAIEECREIWKCKEKEAMLDEYDRLSQIIADKSAEQKMESDAKADRETARDAMIERIARKMLDAECKRREREDIVNELLLEEMKGEIAEKLKNEALEKERSKKELLDDMVRQKTFNAERKAHDAEVDAAFARYMAEQFRIAEQMEKEKDEARRIKGIKEGEELKAAMLEEKLFYAENILRRQALHKQDVEELEKVRLKEVSEERSRMLYEHAPHLEGFLKSGTIRPEDYEYMRARQCALLLSSKENA